VYNVKQATVEVIGWFGKQNKTKYVVTKDKEELGAFSDEYDAFDFVSKHARLKTYDQTRHTDDQTLKLEREHELAIIKARGDFRKERYDNMSANELALAKAAKEYNMYGLRSPYIY